MSSIIDTGFDLDADIGVSDLRSEVRLEEALRTHQTLRLRKRNDLLAVLVSPSRWRELIRLLREQQQMILKLNEALEQYEDEAVRAILAERTSTARLVPLSDESWADVVKRFNELTRE